VRVLRSAAVYFALVFGAGFVLGMIRVPLLVPRLGERVAELLEAPFMAVAIMLAAHWIGRRFAGSDRELLAVGLVAAGLVLAADLLVGVALRGMSPFEVLLERDVVAGSVYYLLVGLFALLPWWMRRRS
jgi:hypothetical protein